MNVLKLVVFDGSNAIDIEVYGFQSGWEVGDVQMTGDLLTHAMQCGTMVECAPQGLVGASRRVACCGTGGSGYGEEEEEETVPTDHAKTVVFGSIHDRWWESTQYQVVPI